MKYLFSIPARAVTALHILGSAADNRFKPDQVMAFAILTASIIIHNHETLEPDAPPRHLQMDFYVAMVLRNLFKVEFQMADRESNFLADQFTDAYRAFEINPTLANLPVIKKVTIDGDTLYVETG